MSVIVEVTGLPPGCPNTDTQTASIALVCEPILLDEYGELKSRDEQARLNNAVLELHQRPNFRMIIVEYVRQGTAPKQIEARKKWLTTRLRQSVQAERLEIVPGGNHPLNRRSTKIYLVASGKTCP